MKIVFVLPGRGISGGVRVTCEMANRLRERGHEVRIIYKDVSGFLDRCKTVRDRLFYRRAEDYLNRFAGSVGVFRNLENCRFDGDEIIVAVGMTISAEIVCLEHLPNPKVQYIHGTTPWAPELMRKALSVPLPKIIVASYLRDPIETAGSSEILALVHNGVDRCEYFSSDLERDGVGFIYSSHWAKDPTTTLGVIELLSALDPAVPIRVFGADRRPKEIGSRMYRRYPSVEEARRIYSRSHVWVMASRSEGFSMPVLEAMACGCCVIATDCGGTRDLIVDGENGFLVPPGNPRAIVNKVELLLGNAELRRRMRHHAELTAGRFNWDSSIDNLEAALASLRRRSCATTT